MNTASTIPNSDLTVLFILLVLIGACFLYCTLSDSIKVKRDVVIPQRKEQIFQLDGDIKFTISADGHLATTIEPNNKITNYTRNPRTGELKQIPDKIQE